MQNGWLSVVMLIILKMHLVIIAGGKPCCCGYNKEARTKRCWWLFADLVAKSNKFAIDGCLFKDDNILCCSLIDLVEANSQEEADVIALKEFVIQEANILESNLEIYYHSNSLQL